MRRGSRLAGRLLLVVGAVALAALAIEAALRVLGLPAAAQSFEFLGANLDTGEFVADDELFRRWSGGGAEVNSLGLRGWLPTGAKEPGELRIACVGDSCTFGVGVRYEETYGLMVEQALREAVPARRVATILAANPGYSTHQNRLLFERHIAPLAPDVTVLYVGGWNDYVAAVGPSDRERSMQRTSPWSSLRLVRLLSRGDVDRRDEVLAAFGRGEAPMGRRVPLSEYEDNVRAMIATAREAGSTVLMVLAPITAASLARHPIAREYRASTLAIAQAAAVPILDAPALFSARHSAAPAEWQSLPSGEWPCLGDWVHPTVTGHRVIATGVVEMLREFAPAHFAPLGESAAPSARIEAVTPVELRLIESDKLTIRGRGFAAPGAIDRVWLGDAWLHRLTVIDDATIEVPIARALRPGDQFVDLLTRRGRVRSPAPVRVAAPSLTVSVARSDGRVVVDVGCRAGPNWASPSGWRRTCARSRRRPATGRSGWLPNPMAGPQVPMTPPSTSVACACSRGVVASTRPASGGNASSTRFPSASRRSACRRGSRTRPCSGTRC